MATSRRSSIADMNRSLVQSDHGSDVLGLSIAHQSEEDSPLDNLDNGKIEVEDEKKPNPESVEGGLVPFVVITMGYLLYTTTDGAIRMIVLLHAYNKKFTAMEVALMFTLYEVAGVMTNLMAGMMGAKWGLKSTLLVGLGLQILGLSMLFGWQDDWSKETSMAYVTLAQMLCGIAKDLTKLGGKTVTKLVTPSEKQGKLFKRVSLVTGMKNSLKGFGYFLGALLISLSDDWGYELSLSVLIFLVLIPIPFAWTKLSWDLGRVRSANIKLKDAFVGYPKSLYLLSAARTFLFMSRDLWFEVPLPFYLRAPSCDSVGEICATMVTSTLTQSFEVNPFIDTCSGGTQCVDGICQNIGNGCGGLGLERRVVGAFLACYIIIYGQIQAWTPQLVTTPCNKHNDKIPPNKNTEVLWGLINAIPTTMMFLLLHFSPSFENGEKGEMIASMIIGLVFFAFVFGVNSSIHSFLVVKYAEGNKAAQSVGFYYMSNAAGRLLGTITSGAIYSYAGDNVSHAIAYCMLCGTMMSFIAVILTYPIDDSDAPVSCGPIQCCSHTIEYHEEEHQADHQELREAE